MIDATKTKLLALWRGVRDLGIAPDRIAELARRHDGTGPIATNPRPVRGADDVAELLKLAV